MSKKITNSATCSKALEPKRHRLPRTVIPSRYAISLTPDLKSFTFTGAETIELEVKEPVTEIRLNAKDLRIQRAYIANDSGTVLQGRVRLSKKLQEACIKFDGKVGAGSWGLFLCFSGTINDRLKGWYRSTWKDDSGQDHVMACTQFEATDARACFPCFDEPDFKAVFQPSLTVPRGYTALSNGRVVSEIDIPGTDLKLVRFAPSRKIATYLVAFIVGELVSTPPVNVNGTAVQIWCRPGKEHLTGFALKGAVFALDYYARYFEQKFTGDHINHVAIPDFAAGAMENDQLVTYREESLLVDEASAPHAALKRVAEVVMHETAHMWRGNWVTMAWWDGLWLNESGATFMENKCLNAWRPDWGIWDEFGLGRAGALRIDALRSTHPIHSPVSTPEEADELFDQISYEKGCSTEYMIEQFVGEEVYRHGLAAYMKKYALGNAETTDLWDCVAASCRESGVDVPVRAIMDAWLLHSGHPVVTVSEGAVPGSVTLCQHPFKFDQSAVDPAQLWPIPIFLRYQANGTVSERKLLLEGRQSTIYLSEGLEWAVVNAGGRGVYRVQYSPEMLARLTGTVQPATGCCLSEKLSVIERFNLLNDSWCAVKAGTTSSIDYLELVKLYQGECDPNVIGILTASLNSLYFLLSDSYRPAMSHLIRELFQPMALRLGWAPTAAESVQLSTLRGTILNTLGTTGDDRAVQAKARECYALYRANPSSLDNNLVPTVVKIVAYTGGQADYAEFFRLFKSAPDPQTEQRYQNALADFRKPELIEQTIGYCLSGDIRSQDAPYLLARAMLNPQATEAAWKYVVSNWEKLVKAYPDSGMVRLCSAVSALDTPKGLAETTAFFSTHKVKGGDKAIAQALEAQQIAVRLREKESPRLERYLVPDGIVPEIFWQETSSSSDLCS